MNLYMIGCSHHDTEVTIRERLAPAADRITEILASFRDRFPGTEMVLLSTCNRVELYAGGTNEKLPNRETLAAFLAEHQSMAPEEVLEHLISRRDAEAVSHLFTVAASLDSMVVGEPQILSQVKQAYDLACNEGNAGPLTHGVFQAANRTAKRVQTETSISRRRVSVPSVAVGEIIPEVFDHLRNKTVVLCGAGEMGQETLRYLCDAGAKDIRILNRNRENGEKLAQEFSVRYEPLDALPQQLVEADVVVGTTAATEPLITADQFKSIYSQRKASVLLVLDLAVPRDFDPEIRRMDGVYHYGIDDLRTACERNQKLRQKEWPRAKAIIDEETDRFMKSVRHQSTGPVISQLREQARTIKEAELQRLITKLPLHSDDQSNQKKLIEKEIDKSFDRLINKILHSPLSSVRDDAAEGHQNNLVDALRKLFNLGDP